MKFLLITILTILASLATSAQSQKKPTKAKKPVVRATVTVKGEPHVPHVYPNETDDGIWNEYSTKDGVIKITFPSVLEKLRNSSESRDDGQIFISLTAPTNNGSYELLTRPFSAITDNREIDRILEDSINKVVSGPIMKIVSKKNIYYGGFLGKELIIRKTVAEGEYIQYSRFFILNSRLITLNVSLDYGVSKEKMEPWIQKFFDSLVVHLPNTPEAE